MFFCSNFANRRRFEDESMCDQATEKKVIIEEVVSEKYVKKKLICFIKLEIRS